MTHSINVSKENDVQVRAILAAASLPFEAFDAPDEYSILNLSSGPVPLEVVKQIIPLPVESATRWLWEQGETDGSDSLNVRKLKLAYGKNFVQGTAHSHRL